jgi:hypothetical protein
VFGNTVNYLVNPGSEGFQQSDVPALGESKELKMGAERNVRFVEGPGGRGTLGNIAMLFDSESSFSSLINIFLFSQEVGLPHGRLTRHEAARNAGDERAESVGRLCLQPSNDPEDA